MASLETIYSPASALNTSGKTCEIVILKIYNLRETYRAAEFTILYMPIQLMASTCYTMHIYY